MHLLQRLRLPDRASDAAGSAKAGADARSLVVQLLTHFLYEGHLCLVFESLGVNLLQLLQQNGCRGLSRSLIRYFSKQLLQVPCLCHVAATCHGCDRAHQWPPRVTAVIEPISGRHV